MPKLHVLLGLLVLGTGLSGLDFTKPATAQIPDPSSPAAWSDSYSVGGQCYCDTNFDHGLSSIQVATAHGNKSIPQICADIKARFGSGAGNGRIYYNTVQCGHSPRNNAADEVVCPGIPRAFGDYSGARCQETGATWNLERLYGNNEVDVDNPLVEPEKPANEPESPHSAPTTVDRKSPRPEIPTNEPDDATGEDTNPSDRDDNTTVASEFPECSSAASDDNGDGYGWENDQSCLVALNNTAVEGQPTEKDARSVESIFPTCSVSVTDGNGDGYGWENDQ